jgi:hypothetical protein
MKDVDSVTLFSSDSLTRLDCIVAFLVSVATLNVTYVATRGRAWECMGCPD